MSHTPARSFQTDVEHLQMAADELRKVSEHLQEAYAVAVAGTTKVALASLIELTEGNARVADRLTSEVKMLHQADGSVH